MNGKILIQQLLWSGKIGNCDGMEVLEQLTILRPRCEFMVVQLLTCAKKRDWMMR
jgi:hypothetical protein